MAAMGNSVVMAGGAIVEVLETKFVVSNPARSDLDAWINKYGLPVTSVRDPDASGLTTYNTLGVRETVYLLDLKTMKIVDKINGSTAGQGDSSAKTGMQRLLVLLGNKSG